MSYELQDLVWEMELPSSEKLVLLALAYRTDAKGFCFPSVPNISKITGLNVKTVRAVLSKLEKLGLLSIDMRPGKATIYTVNPSQNWVHPKTGVPKNNPTQKGVDTTTKIGCTPLPKLVDEQVKNKEITSKEISTDSLGKSIVDCTSSWEDRQRAIEEHNRRMRAAIASAELHPAQRHSIEYF